MFAISSDDAEPNHSLDDEAQVSEDEEWTDSTSPIIGAFDPYKGRLDFFYATINYFLRYRLENSHVDSLLNYVPIFILTKSII